MNIDCKDCNKKHSINITPGTINVLVCDKCGSHTAVLYKQKRKWFLFRQISASLRWCNHSGADYDTTI